MAKRSRDDQYKDAPVSGFVKPKAGLGSDEATNSFLAKLGLSGGIVSSKISKEITIPADMVGMIIGRGGETLKKIQADTGVSKIQISQDHDSSDPIRRISLIGTDAEIERAKKVIEDIVASGDRKSGGGGSHYGPGRGQTVTMEVPGERVGLVIGRGGETIKMLQQKTGARITVVQDGNPRQGYKTVTIQGTDAQIEESKKMISDIVEARVMVGSSVGGGGALGQEMVEVKVPNDRVGLVIGKGGENVKLIQSQFGVRLQIEQIPDANNDRSIKVYGPNQQAIQGAIEVIYEKAGSGRQGPLVGYGPTSTYGAGYGASAGYGQQQQQDPYAAMMGGYTQQDYAAYYSQYYASDPAAYAAMYGQAQGADGSAQDASGAAATSATSTQGAAGAGDATGATAAAGGDDAANAAAWAQYYAYYAQYGAAGDASGTGGAGQGEEAPPGA
ncbi:hypothetical protein BCR33DRAFT_96500 [Rhizoclosmatium globosum]|uniref:K Homology domain-containing protein n=1 Tax=Rhizoclosmatium globosum TaxID=329046 RepID=A0A1Y2CKA5_9FUNG|nr:hypothetical protein BCR33DRAFT_96500 [Rhizoclosmatium globosum]|eukprot:ORY47397.1 hypothetical protein BCR33DRAFT_96500 [Rhizoclosmatium globosum]